MLDLWKNNNDNNNNINHEGKYWTVIKYGIQKKNKSDYNHIIHRNMVTDISEEPASSIFWTPQMLVFFSWIVSFRKLPVTCTAQH
jgi:hypothetical protein